MLWVVGCVSEFLSDGAEPGDLFWRFVEAVGGQQYGGDANPSLQSLSEAALDTAEVLLSPEAFKVA